MSLLQRVVRDTLRGLKRVTKKERNMDDIMILKAVIGVLKEAGFDVAAEGQRVDEVGDDAVVTVRIKGGKAKKRGELSYLEGPSGTGKTTRGREWEDESPETRRLVFDGMTSEAEIEALLDAGIDVMVEKVAAKKGKK